jgi:GntR family transcriptional regulator
VSKPAKKPPKYVQIADEIRHEIVSGKRELGSEIPSERQLAAHWNVARPTATKALDILRREGIVTGRQGAGTFVTGSAFNRRAAERYNRSSETGRIYAANERAEILSAEMAEPPEYVAEGLGLDVGELALKRVRRTLRDEAPIEWSASWFASEVAEAAPLLAVAERILEGTVSYVQARTGREPWKARDRLAARAASRQEAKLLSIKTGQPVLATRHLVLDRSLRPLEFAEALAPADAWTVEHEYLLNS